LTEIVKTTFNRDTPPMLIKKIKIFPTLLALTLLVLPAFLLLSLPKANGATLTNTYLRPYRMKAGQTAKMRLVFRTTTNAGATGVTIDMNGADATTWSSASGSVHAGAMTSDASTCATEIGGGVLGLPGSLTITGATGHTITVTGVTALSASTTYCLDFTNTDAVTLATASEYHPTITETGAATDSTTVAVRTISEDQVVVTASVPPSFNFVFNNTTTDAFGNLTTAGVSTTGKTITINTNATSGWIVWAKSLNGASKGSLTSTAASKTITSSSAIGSVSHAFSAGTEDYGLAVTIGTNGAGGGTPAATTAYDGTSTKFGVLDSQNFQPIATSGGTANGDVINVLERASIAADTPAANDYTDTITFIGAGQF
jgi:hypothetical protein